MEQQKETHRPVRGRADSSWYVIRRCLALLNRLQQGTTPRQDLVSIEARFAEGTTQENLVKRWRYDQKRLKSIGITIKYVAARKGYEIVELETPLLNLSDHHLEAIAFLRRTFEQNSPGHNAVYQLLDQLINWLPDTRRRAYNKIERQQLLQISLQLRDTEQIDSLTYDLIYDAYMQGRVVIFDYLSRSNREGTPRQHRVQPWVVRVNRRQHLELWGYCEWQTTADSPDRWDCLSYRSYRLSRIVPGSVQILSQKLPGERPHSKPEKVIYHLHPDLLHGGLSQQNELIGEPILTERPDGWWQIEGETYSAFSLARDLLYYGDKCRVVNGDQLLREMRGIVQGLAGFYLEDETQR